MSDVINILPFKLTKAQLRVLEEIDKLEDTDAQEEYFNKLLEDYPSWLKDVEHRYDGEMET